MNETPDTDGKGLVTPVIRGMRLLRYIAEGGATSNLSEVGRLIDVNRVTVMRLLATLEHEGLIERLPQGGHRLGLAFLTMAASGMGSVDLLAAGRRVIARLSRDLGASAYLVLPDGGDIVYVQREMPEAGLVSHIRVGSRVAAYQTAPGRAMLATLPEPKLRQLLADRPLARATPDSPASVDDLRRVLRQDREQGCAWSFSGYEAGINACAAAVCDARGEAVAAISVVGPEHLFQRDAGFQARVEQAVTQEAADLSRILAA